MQFNSFGPRKS